MAIRLDTPVGEALYDDIIADTDPTTHITTVKLAASEGPLVKGTVLVAATVGSQCSPASAAITAENAVYILAEDIEKAEADDMAVAYKTGNFIKSRLVTDGEYELADGDIEQMRRAGILVTGMIEAAGSEDL